MIKFNSFLCTAVVALSVVSVTSCGFQLRGNSLGEKQSSLDRINTRFSSHYILLDLERGQFSKVMRPFLQKQLASLGMFIKEEAVSAKINKVGVSDINLQKYDLVGVLTEVRMVMTANVTYDIWKDGVLIQQTYPLQVERSYQHNKASVSFADRQEEQVEIALYKSFAQRVSEQYFAIK